MTWHDLGGDDLPQLCCKQRPSSRIDTEQLVEELHLSGDAGLRKEALKFAHHAHNLDSLERGIGCLGGFEAEHGSSSAFDGAMIGFNLVTFDPRAAAARWRS